MAGATGYTGRHVVRACTAAGLSTIAHVRPDSSRLDYWRQHFSTLGAQVDTTPWDAGAMVATLGALGPSFVFALLGTTRARGKQASPELEESYETVDYALSVLLLEAAMATGTGPRFVYLSSAGAGPRARGAYLRVRWRVEERLRDSGLPYLIARPSIITGPDRSESRAGERAAGVVVDAMLGAVGALGGKRLRERYRSTSGQILGDALVRSAIDPDRESRVLESEELRAR